jgi:cobalt transporter subunit CbtB
MQARASDIETIHASTISTSISKPRQLAAALLLGMVILYVAGFVNTSAVHNVAHDMRHSQGFPCH